MRGERVVIPGWRRIAHHEAGHAVVHALIGRGRFETSSVSIEPEEYSLSGECLVQGHALLARSEDLTIYEYGLATLAGIAAENRFFEEHPPTEEDRQLGAVGDIEAWQTACGRLYPDEGRARLLGLNIMGKLRQIFDQPAVWQVVCNLAAALEERGILEGEELQGVLAPLSEVSIPCG